MLYGKIKFIYNEPALIVMIENKKYLVIGDLHIGIEKTLSHKGIHLMNATDHMVNRIKRLMREFSLKNIILLGDVKNSILYPDTTERNLIKHFFSELSMFDIVVIAGNHDAHLSDIIEKRVKREMVLDGYGFLHGDKYPEESAMLCDYIITAHNHAAIRIRDKNGVWYEEKIWLVSDINKRKAAKSYKKFNQDLKLVLVPAFNDLIIGTHFDTKKENLNPLFRANIFKYRTAKAYNLRGELIKLRSS